MTQYGNPEIAALSGLMAHISAAPKLTDADQRQLLEQLLAFEAAWRDELVAAHGVRVYRFLADLPSVMSARPLFRVRKTQVRKLIDDIRAERWEELAALPVNFPFIAWSRPYAAPSPTMHDLEAQVVDLRHRLVDSILALVWERSKGFKASSKIKTAELGDLIGIGIEGALDATDKYWPEGGKVSAKKWRSTAIGRVLGSHLEFSRSQNTAHLYPRDAERLVALRKGKIADPTAEDLQLLDVNNVVTIATARKRDDDRMDGWDIADTRLNPEEALIAREEEAEREAMLANLPPEPRKGRGPDKKPRKRGGVRGPCPARYVPIRDLDTGEVFPSVTHAADAIGSSISHVSGSIKRGRPCKGRRLERVQ